MPSEVEVKLEPGNIVQNHRFGRGRVEIDKGETVLVRFDDVGYEEVEKASLTRLSSFDESVARANWDSPVDVVLRMQAEAIRSVNDAWGVFSPSRIALLPHQLWVCKRVQEDWPMRWLIADDVGLGKTIEAGLILWPLLARGRVRRFLIICPASLVDQWAGRLWRMFDIRVAKHTSEVDTAKSGFWEMQNQVVASLQTLRKDGGGRHGRIFAAEPWDLVIVDEAHHLNADEEQGTTLGYDLIARLASDGKVESMIFFTGTPHRGKNFGFLALLKLLHPDRFDPKLDLALQLPHLRNVMIRNNKQNVTDLTGTKLFKDHKVNSETYFYSEAESRFYGLLTEFIATGKAYARTLGESPDGRTVMLVLIALQKLASSSVAAIRRALHGRLSRLHDNEKKLKTLEARREALVLLRQLDDYERQGLGDEINKVEEDIAKVADNIRLMKDEEPRLRELVAVAQMVKDETKIEKILEVLNGPYSGRQVLFFTEYKATQSLLMSALIRRYGDGCVAFINGDSQAQDVELSDGTSSTLKATRELAADRFNSGQVRFLVSTEAGGEGIDLQARCYTLIHVDLPWNPMRLHQRVGRLNRYGQTKQVDVLTLRNPDTVESRIWDKLLAKIANINQALRFGMDEPEDMLELVLGMTNTSLFTEVFTEAREVPEAAFGSWFDKKTATFGGRDAIDAVKALVGNCSKFDFQQMSAQIPRVDLPDLEPFVRSILAYNKRKVVREDNGLSFKAPEAWLKTPGVHANYDRVTFDRAQHGLGSGHHVLGVGHKIVDLGIAQAREIPASVSTVPANLLQGPLVIVRIRDRITNTQGQIRSYVSGVQFTDTNASAPELLSDWQTLVRLNELSARQAIRKSAQPTREADIDATSRVAEAATVVVRQALPRLGLPFQVSEVEVIGLLWPTNTALEQEID